MQRSPFARSMAAGVLVVGLLVLAAVPASALNLQVCNGAGNLHATPDGSGGVSFAFTGTARCLLGNQDGPYVATFTGAGGATKACTGNLGITRNFDMDVLMVAQSVIGTPDVVESMTWRLTLTIYPRVTPFLVFQDPSGTTTGDSLKGAGEIISAAAACMGNQSLRGVTFDLAWL